MKKSLIPIIVAAIVIAGIFIIAKVNSSPKVQVADGSNVSIVDGKQIVTINVKVAISRLTVWHRQIFQQ